MPRDVPRDLFHNGAQESARNAVGIVADFRSPETLLFNSTTEDPWSIGGTDPWSSKPVAGKPSEVSGYIDEFKKRVESAKNSPANSSGSYIDAFRQKAMTGSDESGSAS